MRRLCGVALLIALGIGYPVASSAQTPASAATARALLETMQASAMMQQLAASHKDELMQMIQARAAELQQAGSKTN